jgi:hypothetical protein
MAVDVADPRLPVAPNAAARAPLIDLAAESLAAPTASRAAEIDCALASALAERLASGQALLLADTLAAAPSVAIARVLWRQLIDAWALASRPVTGDGVAAVLFALPVVIVAGSPERADGPQPPELSARLSDTEKLAAILREHRALGGNQTFALASALVAADAIEVARLSALLAWQKLEGGAAAAAHDLPPAPIGVQPGGQSVHLRFLLGTALVPAGTDALAETDLSGWAMPFALELARQLAMPELSVLALPRRPQTPPSALQQGRAAQREVGAQLFASNAIRKLRASVGEPSAVISAHRAVSAPGGGELRLSLSSPFDPRQAEGFRCPLFPTDRAGDVATMLVDLLRDCRVTDVRILPVVHADRDPQTGLTLLFKAEAAAAAEQALLH